MPRAIVHVDMNCFYAACHAALEPEKYRGRPVVVAGDPALRHGIILTASYEARAFGIRTGMINSEARRLCPGTIFIPPDYELYRACSRQVLEVLMGFTPVVEPFSIDEAWLDVTGCTGLFGPPAAIAARIQRRVREDLGLPCSVGVSVNKLLAKMATEMRKPNGLTVLAPEDVPDRLWPLPVEELFGVGPRLGRRLREWGIATIGDLAGTPEGFLAARLGLVGRTLWAAAHGRDDAPVDPDRLAEVKSAGRSITLAADTADRREIRAVLLTLADQVGRRLRRLGYAGRTVHLFVRGAVVRDGNGRRLGCARTVDRDLYLGDEIYDAAVALFEARWPAGYPVRLLGVSVSRLRPITGEARQLSLFSAGCDRRERIAAVVDTLRDRFGETAVLPAGVLLERTGGRSLLDQRLHGTSLEKDHLRASIDPLIGH